MTAITTMLLNFLLDLLSDPEAAEAFRDDPQAVLEEAGLGDIGSDDVDAVMPVVLDASTVNSSFDREYNTGGDGTGNTRDRKSTRLNSSHVRISYAVFCLKKK